MQQHQHVGDRRPIGARSWGTMQKAASWLAVRRVSPNLISVSSAVFSIGAGAAMAATPWFAGWHAAAMWLIAAIMVTLRGLANLLDGMVAVERGIASPLGGLYNEVPDRVSDAAILIGMGFAVASDPLLGALAACAAVFVAYVRAQGAVLGAVQDFCGPMAKPHRNAVVTVAAVGMAVLPTHWTTNWFDLAQPVGLPAAAMLLVLVLALFTAARRLIRIARQLREGQP